ncbi:MAG: response regulator [Lachnospiraceae bacterium]|nr:response regulator [Lachnospiraceae bacterium]
MNSREDLLMQIWRDYYDEILDVSLDRGTFESLMDPSGINTRKGFIEIEIMLTAQKLIHPDDRTVFTRFFDAKSILEDKRNGIFVKKLNFRMHRGDGKYFWVKVKGIMPSEGNEEEKRYFVCFRVLDNASDEDMSYRKLLSVSLMHEKEISSQRKELFEKFASEMKSPLNDIAGLADIAKNTVSDGEKTLDRLKQITDKTIEIKNLLDSMIEESEKKNEEIALFDDETYVEMVAKTKKNMSNEEVYSFGNSESQSEQRINKEDQGAFRNTGDGDKNQISLEDFDFTGKKVLVVLDSELSGEIMQEMLKGRGAEVKAVSDGKSAVTDFIKNPSGTYDFVLVDIGSPELDGYSVAHCIRLSCKDDAATVPIFALSNKSTAQTGSICKENGIDQVFSKPLEYGMLFLKMYEAMASA